MRAARWQRRRVWVTRGTRIAPGPRARACTGASAGCEEQSSSMTHHRAHRIVIVGGGFGGLQAALGLRHARVEITLVDRRNFHLFQPLTYQVATGAPVAGEVAYFVVAEALTNV